MAFETLLQQQFGADAFTFSVFRDNRRVIVPSEQLFVVLQFLKDRGGFDMLAELTAADYLTYPDARDRWLADPRFAEVPINRLISKKHASERRALIDHARALPWDKVPSYGSLAGDTVYVAAVDAQGNAASLIFSLYGVFGSCVTSAETGVTLQNRGAYFSLDPKHPNLLEPGKVPLHTLIASLAFKHEKLWAVLGCMGADGQPQIHLQTYVAMIDFGQDIQQALSGPRWLSGRFGLGEARDTLHIEARIPRETIDELERRGHPVDRRQKGQLDTPTVEEGAGADKEGVRSLARNTREDRIDPRVGVGVGGMDLQPHGLSSRLYVSQRGLGMKGRIEKHGDA